MAKNSKKKSSRTSKNKQTQNSIITKKSLAIVILSLFISLSIVYAVNYFQLFDNKKSFEVDASKESTQELMTKMKKMLDDEKKRLISLPKLDVIKKEKKTVILPPVLETKKAEIKKEVAKKIKKVEKDTQFSEVIDYQKSLEKVDKKTLHVEKKKYNLKGKPKLAIIIDDVAFAHQIRLLKKIPYKITPSFFPPTSRHPDTVTYAQQFKFSMIHLPMQAQNHTKPEPDTLRVTDSVASMAKRIREIKKKFPAIVYYNNHTGSKFTADTKAMEKLMIIMKNENLRFVDSRTTAATKAPQVAQKYNLPLYSRDIFLDNSLNKKEITNQLKKAVKIAKKHGFAVAIGHPHVNTLEVLKNSTSLLKDVELVYLKDI